LHRSGNRPGTQRHEAGASTLTGAVCFFIGALLLPARTEDASARTTVTVPGGQGTLATGG